MEQQAKASIYSPPFSLSWIDVVESKDALSNDIMPPRTADHDNTTPARSRFAMSAHLARRRGCGSV